LTKLVAELHQESTAAGGEEGNNPRVAEVRHRIAELVREGGERSGVGGSPLSPIGEMSRVAPPAYELD
jgi:general stress protein YciG